MSVCLLYDPDDNSLRLALDGLRAARRVEIDGTIDIAEGGRLVGIELRRIPGALTRWLSDPMTVTATSIGADGSAYLEIAPALGRHIRSSAVRVWVELDGHGELIAVAVPRRGAGYEIAYPSGNE